MNVKKSLQLAEEALLSYEDITTKQWEEAIAAIRAVKESLTAEPLRFGCLYPTGRLEVFNTRERAQKYVDGTLRNGGDVKLIELYAAPVQQIDLTDDDVAKIKGFYAETIARAEGYTGAMRDLTLDFAKSVYRKRYWDAVIAAYKEKNK